MHYFYRMSSVSHVIHSEYQRFKKIRKVSRYYMYSLIHYTNMRKIESLLDQNKYLAMTPLKFYRLFEVPFNPYGSIHWTTSKRVNVLLSHYNFLNSHLLSDIDNLFLNHGVKLFELTSKKSSEHDYDVYLDTEVSKEGALGLKIMKGQDVLYSLSFTIFSNDNNHYHIHVGSLQGPKKTVLTAHEDIKDLTKSCHGLRPKSLILEVLRAIAHAWDITSIEGISNRGHIYNAWRYRSSKLSEVKFNYDEFWQESGATKKDKYTYSVPTNTIKKDLEQLNRTKRKVYAKRYQLLDHLYFVIDEKIKLNLAEPLNEGKFIV